MKNNAKNIFFVSKNFLTFEGQKNLERDVQMCGEINIDRTFISLFARVYKKLFENILLEYDEKNVNFYLHKFAIFFRTI